MGSEMCIRDRTFPFPSQFGPFLTIFLSDGELHLENHQKWPQIGKKSNILGDLMTKCKANAKFAAVTFS